MNLLRPRFAFNRDTDDTDNVDAGDSDSDCQSVWVQFRVP